MVVPPALGYEWAAQNAQADSQIELARLLAAKAPWQVLGKNDGVSAPTALGLI